MRRWLPVLAVVLASAAVATEETPAHATKHPPPGVGGRATEVVQKHEEPPQDTAGYILHHVLDSDELGFQVPLADREFIYRFPVWRIPLKAGACPRDVREPASLSRATAGASTVGT